MKFPLCKLPSPEWKEWSKSEENYCSSQHMQPVCNLCMVMADSIKIRMPTFSQEAVLREKKTNAVGVVGGCERGWGGGQKKAPQPFLFLLWLQSMLIGECCQIAEYHQNQLKEALMLLCLHNVSHQPALLKFPHSRANITKGEYGYRPNVELDL